MRVSVTRIMTSGKLIPSVVPVGLAILCMGATPGFAQLAPGQMMGAGSPQQAARHGGEGPKAEAAPPPVLPGTKGASEAAAPSASSANLSPTDGLFDAINRGDLASARDAVNRGANMDAQNLLGLTPLDLSVDLGRNDISFMLLSMRGEDTSPRHLEQKSAQRDAARRDGGVVTRTATRTRASTAFVAEAADDDVSAPRVYSGSGGAPIPAAGFVGFDGGRSVR
jgi:hypothetical protein